ALFTSWKELEKSIAKEKEKLDDIFHLKNSESLKKKRTKLYNKRNASKLEIKNAISLIEESANLGCVYAKNFLEFFFNPNSVNYIIKYCI
ncbi:30926_t:CDS:2, partial [Gigaspora margarita]